MQRINPEDHSDSAIATRISENYDSSFFTFPNASREISEWPNSAADSSSYDSISMNSSRELIICVANNNDSCRKNSFILHFQAALIPKRKNQHGIPNSSKYLCHLLLPWGHNHNTNDLFAKQFLHFSKVEKFQKIYRLT